MSNREQQIERRIGEIVAGLRVSDQPVNVLSVLARCKAEGIQLDARALGRLEEQFGGESGCLLLPVVLAKFVGKFLAGRPKRTLLNPWFGLGVFSLLLQELVGPEEHVAFSGDPRSVEAHAALFNMDNIELVVDESLEALRFVERRFDLVAGSPPFGEAGNPLVVPVDGEDLEIEDDLGFEVIFLSCLALADEGTGVFIVPNTFFQTASRGCKTLDMLKSVGFRIEAAIELPRDTFLPQESISTHLILVRRGEAEPLFTARYSNDPAHQKNILTNFRKKRNGKWVTQGRWVPHEEFAGFSHLERAEILEKRAKRMGFVPVPVSDLVTEVHTPTVEPRFSPCEERENSIYLSNTPGIPVTLTQDAFPSGMTDYVQLVINPETADARFLAGLLNTEFGRMMQDAIRQNESDSQLHGPGPAPAVAYLPPPEDRQLQSSVVSLSQEISRLKNELTELESDLWKRPNEFKTIGGLLKQLNQADPVKHWIDTLPFPLASILWVCRVSTGSAKERYERKLQFFEALAEFLSVVHLSAWYDSPNWPETLQNLRDDARKYNTSLEFATFGTWRTILQVLSARARYLLEHDPQLCYELYKTSNHRLLDLLARRDVIRMLEEVNTTRNNYSGHVGALSESRCEQIDRELEERLLALRALWGTEWESFQLVLPGECRYQGGVFSYSALRTVGNNIPFEVCAVDLPEPMVDGQLHLWSPDEQRTLRLLPLVKVMPSPQTGTEACYFYNRRQAGNKLRFLSYHFAADSELMEEFKDAVEVLDALDLQAVPEEEGTE